MALKNRLNLTSDSLNVESNEINAKIVYPNPFSGSGKIEAQQHREVDHAILDVIQDLIDSSLNFITDKATPLDINNNKWVPSDDIRLYDERIPINNSVSTIKIQDGAVTTVKLADDSVTNIKLANMPAFTLKGNNTSGTFDPQDLTPSQVRTMLNIADGANNYIHPNHTGDVSSLSDGLTTIEPNVVNNMKLADMSPISLKGNNLGVTSDPMDLTPAQVRTMLNVADGAQVNFPGINSIEVVASSYQLVNDLVAPGSGMIYGTNSSGVRGWYPAGSVVSGDNWGTQVAITNSTLTGNGTTANPLSIAQQGASAGQVLSWTGTTWSPASVNTEATTVVNLGVGGLVYQSMAGNEIRLRSLYTSHPALVITTNTVGVDFKIEENQLQLQNLSGVVPLNRGGTGIAAANAAQALNALLPLQTGESGKVLTTNGTTHSWQPASGANGVNLGTGSITVYAGMSGSTLQFNTWQAGSNINLLTSSNTTTVSWTGAQTTSPITGTGISGNPLKLINGTTVGDTLVWNGANWAAMQNPFNLSEIVAYVPAANIWLMYTDLSTCISTLDANYPAQDRILYIFKDLTETIGTISINANTRVEGNNCKLTLNTTIIGVNGCTLDIHNLKIMALGKLNIFTGSRLILCQCKIKSHSGDVITLYTPISPTLPHTIDNCSLVSTIEGSFSVAAGSVGVDTQFLGRNCFNMPVDLNINQLIGTTTNYGIIVDPLLSLNF